MQITKITKQNRNNDKYNIFIDEEYFCAVKSSTILQLGLKKGLKLESNEKLEEIFIEGMKDSLLDNAFYFLSFRDRSEKEIVNYLKKKVFDKYQTQVKEYEINSSEIIDSIIKKLKSSKYINDEKFASQYIKHKTNTSTPKSKRAIASDLYKKGISQDTVNRLVDELDQTFETENALKIVSKKLSALRKTKKLSQPEIKTKLIQHLAYKGYPYEIALGAVDTALNHN